VACHSLGWSRATTRDGEEEMKEKVKPEGYEKGSRPRSSLQQKKSKYT